VTSKQEGKRNRRRLVRDAERRETVEENGHREQGIRRRRGALFVVALAVVFAAIAASCGGGEEGAAEPPPAPAPPAETGGATTAPAEEPAGEPTTGGTLIMARDFETQSLDPMGPADNGSIFARVQIFNTLVEADPETLPEVGPGIAESWESSPDGLTWTFHLREAQFSNGDPVTAEDVKFSLDRFIDPEINVNIPSLAFGIESIEIVDDRTIQINLEHPVGALLENLSVFPASIVNQKAVEAEGDEHWQDPVGTGPFMVKEWVPGSHLLLERNPNYWEEGKPYVDEVRMEFLPDANARMLKIQSAEADVAEGVPFTQIQQIEDVEGVRVETTSISAWEGVFLNHAKPPFDDINIRKALNLATDKEALNAAVYGGVAETANDMIPKGRFTAPPEEIPPYAFDLEQAKELMAQSSMPDGFSATFLYPAGSVIHEQTATILQAQWAEIGVEVTIEPVDAGALFERYLAGDWEIAIPLPHFTADVTVNDEVATLFWDNNPENVIRAFATGWPVPQELVDLTQQAAMATDEAQRTELWPQVQQMAMDGAPWVTLFFIPSVTAVGEHVQGFQTLPNAWWDLEDVWLER
jgi:peptide/nickel transport system substrate-binding protein